MPVPSDPSVPGGAPSEGGPPRTLVVMAAGMGSRYGGLKQVEPVGPSGEIILDYSVYDALRAGFERVVFVVRREIENDFRDAVGRRIEARVDTAYAHQELNALPDGFELPADRVKPWGTGHAVLCAGDEVPGAFAAINADDFYGAGAFAAVGAHLASTRPGTGVTDAADGGPAGGVAEYCMAGYYLHNTLSEHGHVSRGVCSVSEEGFLEGIVERETIERRGDAISYRDADGSWVAMAEDSVVSMNIWGFDAGFFARLEEGFRAFLENNIDRTGAECYLPAVVDDLIAAGRARVRVLPTDERWFGITYREDAPAAAAAVLARVEAGVYPEKLWG